SWINENATLQITNMVGQVVYEKKSMVTDGKLHMEIELAAYQKGVFLLHIVVNDQTFIRKLVLEE
ncbi:MAG: T9SS type A sorting domain-containing protein, partial [Chitinophagales bacterium]